MSAEWQRSARRGGPGGVLRPSFHLSLFVIMLAAFLAQIPLGVFGAWTPLDSTAHVLLPAAATALLYDALYARAVHTAVQSFATMVLLGVSAEMVWEVLEFTSDTTFGLAWQRDNADTMRDIVSGIVGSVLGAGVRVRTSLRTGPARQGPPATAAPAFSYRLTHNRAGDFAYQAQWVIGSVGSWCRHWHPSVAEADRCARERWARAKPALRRLVLRLSVSHSSRRAPRSGTALATQS